MILHYIEEHGYLPPKQFIDSVLESPIPGTKDYKDAVVEFWELHKRYRERQQQERFEEASHAANAGRSPGLDRILSEKNSK